MAQSLNQRLKLLYLMKIMLEKTDETHSITMQEIISSLKAYGIDAERKSIYTDMDLPVNMRHPSFTGRCM